MPQQKTAYGNPWLDFSSRKKAHITLVTPVGISALFRVGAKNRILRIGLEVLLWALTIFVITVFLRAGWDKFDSSSGWSRAFAYWGYPVWFRVLIGLLEVASALLLVWPRTAAYGAAIIIVIMLGGMGTHVFIEHRPSRVTSELGQLIFASIILAGRWRTRINPLAR